MGTGGYMPSIILRVVLSSLALISAACGTSSSLSSDESGSAASTVTVDPASLGMVQTVTSENFRAVIQQSFVPVPSISGKTLTIRIGSLTASDEEEKQ